MGSVVEHSERGSRGVCMAAEEWESPATHRVSFTVFVRPLGGGKEWTAPPSKARLVVDAG